LYSTYVVGLDELISPDGRIHTSYLQHRTVTGRLASTDPNTQNIPRESTIRQLFTAAEGWHFIIADFKQAELRVWAYCSQDEQFIQALTTSNVHNVIGARLLNKPEDKITKEEKNRVKQAVFGVAYGRGTHSLAAEWKMSYQEAQAFIDKFFAMMPKAYQWLLNQEDFAKKNGYVKSIFGRVRRLPMINSSEESLKAQALRFARNAPIQSASSDLTNLSLVRIDREFKRLGMKSRLLMQVHDSIAIESPPEEVKDVVAIMNRCMTTPPFPEFNVPLAADIEVSDRWGGDKINLDDL